MKENYDYIVIGAGINGLWTAYHLSKSGYSTLLLEQFHLDHNRGSSHGRTRGIRKAYPQSFLSEMMDDAYRQWRVLEEEAGKQLIKITGLLSLSDSGNDYVKKVVKSLKATPGANFSKEMNSKELMEEYPLKLEADATGVLDHDGGIIFADEAIAALLTMIKTFGCDLLTESKVDGIFPQEEEVRVSSIGTSYGVRRVFSCKSVIICAGPWANKILALLGLEYPLITKKVSVFYWPVKDFLSTTFYSEMGNTKAWGLPPYEYPGLAKICLHEGQDIDPDDIISERDTSSKKKVKEFLEKYCPGVISEPALEESCIYTMTPDEIHIMDYHPKYPNVIVGCGFSGTGFKMGPVTGQILADLATGKKSVFDSKLHNFRASRFST